jgi:hypothetical protein
MKTFMVVVLILVLILTLVPNPMGMSGMGWCPACLVGHSGTTVSLCLAVLATEIFLLALAFIDQRFTFPFRFIRRLYESSLLRPPRLALGL